MKSILKIILGFSVLFTVGFILVAITGIKPQDLNDYDYAEELVWIRITLYVALIYFWSSVTKFYAKRREKNKLKSLKFHDESEGFDESMREEIEKTTKVEIIHLNAIRWKAAIFILIFEIGIVQRFWL